MVMKPAGAATLSFRGAELLLDSTTGLPAAPPSGAERIDALPARFGLTEAAIFSAETPAPEGAAWVTVRSLLGARDYAELRPVLKALALFNWRATTRHCGRCGTRTEDKADEIARSCPACGGLTYPRLSPAILAVVTRDGKLMLARNASFKGGTFSLVAGFVEPAESFEDCVIREVREEVGIAVENPRYLGSQGWPFPDSLMVGFEADWVSGELEPDGVEIAEAGWFAPGAAPPLPPAGSLSRKLIDAAFERLAGGTSCRP